MRSRVTFPSPRFRATLAVVLGCLFAAAAPGAGPAAPTREDSERLLKKVDAIVRNAALAMPASLETTVTEREVNAYLAYDGKAHLPAGLTEPRIVVLPTLALSGTAVVDLDAIRAQRQSRGMLDPLNYLSGKVDVSVSGRLEATNGAARFALESAKLGGVTVPKFVVQELLSYYTKTAQNPRGVNLDDPYPLPAHIREIQVRRSEALVKQ